QAADGRGPQGARIPLPVRLRQKRRPHRRQGVRPNLARSAGMGVERVSRATRATAREAMTPRQTYRSDDDPDWDGELADEDSEADLLDGDEEPTIPCPYCGREILEDLMRCPYCERIISQEDAPRRPKS